MSSRSLRRNRRAAAAGALAATLGFAGLGLAASPAGATADFDLERLAGVDRIETAVEISQDTFPSATTALIARADLYPDALAGNYLAGAEQGPILLSHTDEVPAETLAELERLGVTDVVLLGGTAALSEDVHDSLTAAGYNVNREAGTDRYETAAEIATSQDAAGIGEVDGARTAILATGERFPDALTGGPLAYAGSHPILLTPTATLGDDAAAALDSLGIEHVLILGGSAAVSDAAEAQVEALGITTERLAGTTRYSTATEIAEWAIANAGFSNTHVDVATGQNFPDALTGGPHAGENMAPILLANDGNTAEAVAFLESIAATVAEGHIFGGTAAVSAAVEAALEEAGQSVTTNQSFVASPAGNQTVEAGTVQQFSFSGITPGSRVDIQLVDCSNVATDANGVTTFSGTNPGGANNVAQNDSAPTATVTVVNGVASGATDQVLVPSNGTVTFSVDTTGDANTCYVAVVFADADDDDRIDLNPNGTPSEAFGNSGDVTVVAAEAADNFSNPGTVTYVDLANNLFSTVNGTFYYDSNDEFILAATPSNTPLTMEQFEARLSVGDSVAGTYRNNPANQSSFTLTDAAPVAPASVTAQTPGDDGQTANVGKQGVQLNFPQSGTATTASYNIYRATAIQPTVIGQTPTCPTSPTAYSVVGTVADTATATEYWFLDSTAQPAPSTTPTNPQYCYFVTAVDVTGDEGPASSNTGPVSASAATTASAMSFQANADTRVVNANTINVDYNNVVNGATVAANGSDFIVTATTTGTNPVSEDITVLSATKNAGDADGDLVTIVTSEAIPAGQTITVTSKTGTDGNTVCAGTTTTNCQPVGQTVAVSTTGADVAGPTAASATETGGVVTAVFNEAVDFLAGQEGGFTIIADGGTCGTSPVLGTGTAVTDTTADDAELDIDFGTFDPATGTAYELCVAANTVEDQVGNNNAATTTGFTGAA